MVIPVAKNKKSQSRTNYFNLQFQNIGDGWMGRLTTQDVRKSALRLFKDIASGNVNANKDMEYFNEPNFTYNLKLAADDNMQYNGTIYTALNVNPYKNAFQQKLCDEHYNRYCAYSVLSQCLNNILIGIQINGGIQTDSFISDMVIRLQPYKYSFNGYFLTICRRDDGKLRNERRYLDSDDKRSNSRSIGPVKGFPNQCGV